MHMGKRLPTLVLSNLISQVVRRKARQITTLAACLKIISTYVRGRKECSRTNSSKQIYVGRSQTTDVHAEIR